MDEMEKRAALRRMAEEIGLARLAEVHPTDLELAVNGARDLAAKLPRDLVPADEPAHIFQPGGEAWQ